MLFVIQFYIIKTQDAALCSALCILNSSSDNHTCKLATANIQSDCIILFYLKDNI